MEKYLSMVSPDDVETQALDWGQFQWPNEPRVTRAEKMIVGIGRIKPGTIILTARNLSTSWKAAQNR